jgi:hypothetical protein
MIYFIAQHSQDMAQFRPGMLVIQPKLELAFFMLGISVLIPGIFNTV